ncbi:MAG TPA: CHAD domain-containing protein [Burkholderiales bacterium]|jgi:inorganic triphosphatase YgiF|nr:CHAD domain-containing protein [Burkholderiales bacterium]
METELKLRVPPEAVKRIASHPLFKSGARAPVQKLRAVYYDTPNLDLWRKGAALRVRREGTRWIQTVNWSGETKAGVHERNELEIEVPGPAPDCGKFLHADIEHLFSPPELTGSLKPVFETNVRRSTRMLDLGDVVIEANFDRGEITSGERREPVSELELELKRGAAPALFRTGLHIVETAPVALENRSKAERGYALYRDTFQTPLKAFVPALDASMSVSDAFAAIGWSALKHLQGNEQGVLEGADPEFLHQMRVAVRRLRSALSAFSEVLPAAERIPMGVDLKWLGGVLGPARDWDVFVTETLPVIRGQFEEWPALARLAEQSARLQARAHRRAHRAMGSRRYQRVLIGLASSLAVQRWREHPESDAAALLAPARVYAQGELERRYEQVRKRGRNLGTLSAEGLHQLRIAIKKLRYSVDFFASLFNADAIKRFRSRLSRLQDVLGTLNDAAMLRHLVESACKVESEPALAEARGIVLGWRAGRSGALKDELDRFWKGFRRSETYW